MLLHVNTGFAVCGASSGVGVLAAGSDEARRLFTSHHVEPRRELAVTQPDLLACPPSLEALTATTTTTTTATTSEGGGRRGQAGGFLWDASKYRFMGVSGAAATLAESPATRLACLLAAAAVSLIPTREGSFSYTGLGLLAVAACLHFVVAPLVGLLRHIKIVRLYGQYSHGDNSGAALKR
jgi:hypothetical protein